MGRTDRVYSGAASIRCKQGLVGKAKTNVGIRFVMARQNKVGFSPAFKSPLFFFPLGVWLVTKKKMFVSCINVINMNMQTICVH